MTEQIGVRASPPLDLRDGARLRFEISRTEGQYLLRILAMVPTGGLGRRVAIRPVVLDGRQYPTEHSVWLALQQLAQDRLCNLADVHELDPT